MNRHNKGYELRNNSYPLFLSNQVYHYQNEYLNNEEKLRTIFSSTEIERINQIVILPNVEFRLKKLLVSGQNNSWNRKVNFHVIFSDKVPVEYIEDFLKSLTFETEFTSQGKQKESLTLRNIEELGNRIKKVQSSFKNSSDVHAGMINIAIDEDDIMDSLASRSNKFKGNYLLGLPADEDLSLINWNSQGYLERRKLFQKVNFCFSSNLNTKDFWLGKKHETESKFIEEFISIKPCLWGSDAHTAEKLFEPDLKRYTWIKGDPTFEGLKQVVLEPDHRVLIQTEPPSEKVTYNIIDRVRFVEKIENKVFPTEWINFNDDLNVVIGGKSSGKSLLLYHIAKAVDPQQVKELVEKIKGPNYLKLQDNTDVEVCWKNGTIDRLSESVNHGQLTYLPQLYINILAEEEGQNDFFKLIQSILYQNKSYKEFDDSIRDNQQEVNAFLVTLIHTLESHYQFADEKNADLNKLDKRENIENEILSLNVKIAGIVEKSNLSVNELAEYKSTQDKIEYLKTTIKDNEILTKNFNKHTVTINKLSQNISELIQPSRDEILEIADDDMVAGFEEFIETINYSFENYIDIVNKSTTNLNSKKLQLQETLEIITDRSKPLFDKIEESNSVFLLRERLDLEHKKIQLHDDFEKDLGIYRQQISEFEAELIVKYTYLMNLYVQSCENVNVKYKDIAHELTLSATISFDSKSFSEKFLNMFDKRVSLHTVFEGVINDESNYQFDRENHIANIESIFNKINPLNKESVRLKSTYSKTDLLKKLFEDYFKIDYTIEYKGDDMTTMSPGKRGLVLLQLILHISNSSSPILIDQPEDNLDNRTVYNELRQFIREKKAQRQIILVTHNANLVVSTDAENVIVSNQDGQQAGKENRKYRFEYISGALENTFYNPQKTGILYKQGIREHVCEILEGGKEAFIQREKKYEFL